MGLQLKNMYSDFKDICVWNIVSNIGINVNPHHIKKYFNQTNVDLIKDIYRRTDSCF